MRRPALEVQRSGRPSPSLKHGVELEGVRQDKAHMLGRLLDLFLFREIRGAIKEVLGIDVRNGTGG